jgi:hypothetical protein
MPDNEGRQVVRESAREPPVRTMSRGQRRVVTALELIVELGKLGRPFSGNGFGPLSSAVLFFVWVLTLPCAYALVVARNWHKP